LSRKGPTVWLVKEVSPRRRGPLGEKQIQPAALRHHHERVGARTLEPATVAEPELDPVDDGLDDRRDRARKQANGSHRQTAAARLVTREAGPIEEKHGSALRRQGVRSQRSGRPGSDDNHVKARATGDPRHEPPRDRASDHLVSESDSTTAPRRGTPQANEWADTSAVFRRSVAATCRTADEAYLPRTPWQHDRSEHSASRCRDGTRSAR
jgi:hypothetical protein